MVSAELLAKRGQGLGYNRVTLDGKVIEESDTFQCAHCNDTAFMKKIEAEEAAHRAKMLLWKAADNV
jgi:hypothetical protein